MLPAHPVTPPRLVRPPSGTWAVPGSKSLTNRALVLAALAEGTSILENVLESDDTRHMRSALAQLGIGFNDIGDNRLLIEGGRSRLRPSPEPLFIGNSGTTVRFLAALAALVPGATTLVGDEHMAKRPIADLVEGLRQLGIPIDCASGCPPLTVHGSALPGGQVRLRGDRSSQYFSALLMAAGLASAPVEVLIEGELVSRPYVDMTRRLISDFGGTVRESATGFIVHPCGRYRCRSTTIEPDASAASYPFALAAATGGSLRVPHLPGDSLQGDVNFVEVLSAMGARVERTAHYVALSGPQRLTGIDIDMHHISDCVMSLAAIAPLCDRPTTIRNVANIRIKECDRLAATVTELRRLGQDVTHGDDWLRIEPRPLRPATVACYGDHRMAMSFAILGLATGAVTIEDPACVAKTYPGFWRDCLRCCAESDSRTDWL
jgi:3-phosphoshikimate 1-carboxyvinyltransferase